MAPTWTRELAAQLVVLVRKMSPGIVHATCSGRRDVVFDAARKALALAGLDVPLTETTTAAYGARAPRPLYSVLEPTTHWCARVST